MLNFDRAYSLKELCKISGAKDLYGDPGQQVSSLSSLQEANADTLSFFVDDGAINNFKTLNDVESSNAGIVILSSGYDVSSYTNRAFILHDNPKLGLAKIIEYCFDDDSTLVEAGLVHPSATINANTVIDGSNVSIGANVVIGANCKIGKGVKLMPNVVIDDNVSIGADTVIHPNVTIYKNVKIGANCLIQSSAVIGSNGFGYARTSDAKWKFLPHMASVAIGDNVHIGSGTCIDRGLVSDTIIGAGCIIDNLVQIGHNVSIGNNTAIAGCSGIAGSTAIGERCMFGGSVRVAVHLNICDDVMLSGSTCVNRSISKPGIYSSGMHSKPRALWQKCIARFYRLDDMAKKLNKLEKNFNNLNIKEKACE